MRAVLQFPEGTDVDPRVVRLYGNPLTLNAGIVTAPAANAVIADTGALAAGDYDFLLAGGVSDTVAVGKGLVVEHRNAANGATLFTLGSCGAEDGLEFWLIRYAIVLNERVRVIAGTVAGAASSRYQARIARRVAG